MMTTQAPLEQLYSSLRDWGEKAVRDYQVQSVYLFGSLIHKNGSQFNEHSDIDLVVVMPPLDSALKRFRWIKSFSEHKDSLEVSLMKLLKRDATTPIVSIVLITSFDLALDVHKDGHPEFFTANTFRNLVSSSETLGIPYAGTDKADRFVKGSLAFAQKVRNEFLSVSANGTVQLVAYDGDEPIPKRFMRAAAVAARARGNTSAVGVEHDVKEGLDALSNYLYGIRETAPVYRELQDLLSVRRKARGKNGAIEADNLLLLGELIYELAAPTHKPTPKTDAEGQSGECQGQQSAAKDADSLVEEAVSESEPGPTRQQAEQQRTAMPASSTTAFFADRFASAFPGIRNITWYSDPNEIETRLLMLLRQPLVFSDATPVWWWRGGNLHIERFTKIKPGTFLMDVEELAITSIAALPGISYHHHFVYVQTAAMQPTGLYSAPAGEMKEYIRQRGYDREEYGLFNGQHLITRDEYDDGHAMIGGQLVRTIGQADLRVRFTTPYNFVIAANGSPINNPAFDSELEKCMNQALQGDPASAVEELHYQVKKLPVRSI